MGKRDSHFKNKDKKRLKVTQKSEPSNGINKKGFGPVKKSRIPCSKQGTQNQDSEFQQQVDVYTSSPGRPDEEHDLNQDNPSEYNNLLKVLSSGNKNLIALYKKRTGRM